MESGSGFRLLLIWFTRCLSQSLWWPREPLALGHLPQTYWIWTVCYLPWDRESEFTMKQPCTGVGEESRVFLCADPLSLSKSREILLLPLPAPSCTFWNDQRKSFLFFLIVKLALSSKKAFDVQFRMIGQ